MLDADALALPAARGTLSAAILDILRRPMHDVRGAPAADDDPMSGEDHPLALYLLHELHHRGLKDVDDGWEWEPSLLAVRRHLERELMGRAAEVAGDSITRTDVEWALDEVGGDPHSQSSWGWLAKKGTSVHVHELWVLRAPERLRSGSSVLLSDDPVGPGVLDPLTALDAQATLDLDRVPGWALAGGNLSGCMRLQRRWRGARAGFDAAREQLDTVVAPAATAALTRLEMATVDLRDHAGPIGTPSARRRAAALARAEPALSDDLLFGGLIARWLELTTSLHALVAWQAGASALRPSATMTFAA